MGFQWDDDKNDSNKLKHGVDFSEAKTVFGNIYFFHEDGKAEDEQVFVALGPSSKPRLLVVAYTYRRNEDDEEVEDTRIISARPAEPAERKDYEKAIKARSGR